MATCGSCGGIIGRDCFNPSECEQISRQQEEDHQWHHEQAVLSLEGRVEELERLVSEIKARTQLFEKEDQ